MSGIPLLSTAAAGMDAQRAALEVAAQNVAAAEAAGPKGSFEALVPDFRTVRGDDGDEIAFAGAHRDRGRPADMLTEMVAVANASRAYEANASVFDIGKRLAERTIDMGRV